ncbi:MAG: response regulator [Elusimicrobiota bacterium]|nr:response regulator [Elusimicrobiota bacterium]
MADENSAVTILMAEDDDGHALLVQQRFESVGVNNPIIRFRTGQETMNFLSGTTPGIEPGKSYLLLLDIRMPGLDGIEVLRRMKADARLKRIPVVMLTTTDDPREIALCYDLGCSSYLTKPVEFDKFAEVIKRLGLFLNIIRISKIKAA